MSISAIMFECFISNALSAQVKTVFLLLQHRKVFLAFVLLEQKQAFFND